MAKNVYCTFLKRVKRLKIVSFSFFFTFFLLLLTLGIIINLKNNFFFIYTFFKKENISLPIYHLLHNLVYKTFFILAPKLLFFLFYIQKFISSKYEDKWKSTIKIQIWKKLFVWFISNLIKTRNKNEEDGKR